MVKEKRRDSWKFREGLPKYSLMKELEYEINEVFQYIERKQVENMNKTIREIENYFKRTSI